MKDEMNDALRRKRARGLDLTIVIGGGAPINSGAELDAEKMHEASEKEAKDLDLAPDGSGKQMGSPGEMAEHPDKMQDMQMIKEMIGASGKQGLNSRVANYWDKKAQK